MRSALHGRQPLTQILASLETLGCGAPGLKPIEHAFSFDIRIQHLQPLVGQFGVIRLFCLLTFKFKQRVFAIRQFSLGLITEFREDASAHDF